MTNPNRAKLQRSGAYKRGCNCVAAPEHYGWNAGLWFRQAALLEFLLELAIFSLELREGKRADL